MRSMTREEGALFIGNWLETTSAKAAISFVARHYDASDTDGDIVARQINAARALSDWAFVGANHGSEKVVASASTGIEAQVHSFVDDSGGA